MMLVTKDDEKKMARCGIARCALGTYSTRPVIALHLGGPPDFTRAAGVCAYARNVWRFDSLFRMFIIIISSPIDVDIRIFLSTYSII